MKLAAAVAILILCVGCANIEPVRRRSVDSAARRSALASLREELDFIVRGTREAFEAGAQ